MKLQLRQTASNEWQADLNTEDGRDFHGRATTPGRALVELGLFVEERLRPPSDMEVLVKLFTERSYR